MASNETPEQEIEHILQEHFSAESDDLHAPGDTWDRLESRLGEQAAPPRFGWFRDWFFPAAEHRWTPAVAMTVVAVVAVVAAASVWLATDNGGGDDPYARPFSEEATPAAIPASGPAERDGSASAVDPAGATSAPQARAPLASTQAPAATAAAPAYQSTTLPAPTPTLAAPAWTTTATQASQPTTFPAAAATTAPQATAAPAQAMSGSRQAQQESALMEPEPTPAGAPAQQEPPSATTFRDYARQPFVDTRDDNVSTFSLDTDRTSYQLALNWAREGYDVNPASVRAEEWTNAFDYQYPPPAQDDRFAIYTDVMPHPLDESIHLARVAFQASELRDDTPLNVTLVLDASGSMADGNRVAIAREAAETIRRSLVNRDRIAVVHFTDDVIRQLTVKHERPNHREVEWSISQLSPHGSTNVQAGLDLGVRLADEARRDRPDAYNYIIVMSDGVANVDATNPFSILESAYDADSRNPLRIITVGVGIENYNDYLLEQIAQHGNGWYRYLSDTGQARSTFARENWLALSAPFADQTRAQIIWDPQTVASWRIIGYENRVTPDETFTQDRKEFAEIPSGAATTVFYELELHSRLLEDAKLGEIELRWLTPKTGRSNSQHADVRYSESRWPPGDPMLEFGAIVALSADRYSGLGYADREDWRHDLSALQDRARRLEGELSHLQAYRDFSFLLEHIAGNAQSWPTEDRSSGYSR